MAIFRYIKWVSERSDRKKIKSGVTNESATSIDDDRKIQKEIYENRGGNISELEIATSSKR